MQRNFELYYPDAFPGLLSGCGDSRINPYMNYGASINDTWTLEVPDTPTPNTTYTVTVDGVSVSVDTGNTVTNTELELNLYSAMRSNPEFYSKAEVTLDSANDLITLTARYENQFLVVSAPLLTVVQVTTTIPDSSVVPFGRFVARNSNTRKGAAHLPQLTTDLIVGVTKSTHAIERTGIGQDAETGYYPGAVMNVVDRIGTRNGIWVDCVEPDLDVDDMVYITVGSDGGKVTRSTTGTINFSAQSKIVKPTYIFPEQSRNLVLVAYNLL